MSSRSRTDKNPASSLRRLRKKIEHGSRLLVEELTDDELAAMHTLLLEGEAEIISLACKPYLAARQDKIIISH